MSRDISARCLETSQRAPGRNRTCDSRFRNSFQHYPLTSEDSQIGASTSEPSSLQDASLRDVSLPFAGPPRGQCGTTRPPARGLSNAARVRRSTREFWAIPEGRYEEASNNVYVEPNPRIGRVGVERVSLWLAGPIAARRRGSRTSRAIRPMFLAADPARAWIRDGTRKPQRRFVVVASPCPFPHALVRVPRTCLAALVRDPPRLRGGAPAPRRAR